MKLFAFTIVMLLLALAFGCERPAPQPEPDMPPTPPTVEDAADGITMSGIDLYMHRSEAREGMPVKPELWVQADSLTMGENNNYVFENARAVIYGADDIEEIVIQATRGDFEQDTRAILEGDVHLTAGTLHMRLSDIEWRRPENEGTGAAYSDNPVIIDDPDLQLNARGLRLYPDERVFELTNVSGVVRFGEKLL